MMLIGEPSKRKHSVSFRGRKIYFWLLALIALSTLVLFIFPGIIFTVRCCNASPVSAGLLGRLAKIRAVSSEIRQREVASFRGHRQFKIKKKLDKRFRFVSNGGPHIKPGVEDLRGAIFKIFPHQGESWQLPVGGTPGVPPVWSNTVGLLAVFRLNRLWLSDREGRAFVDIAKFPPDFVSTKILWRCDGLVIAVGDEKLGWGLVPLFKDLDIEP